MTRPRPGRTTVAADTTDGPLPGLAAELLAAGEVVVLPTETVYGLAADPRSAAGVARLRTLKARTHAPFTHHLASAAGAAALGLSLPPHARRLADRYWPGPLTLIVPGAGGELVGLRVPAVAFTRRVIELCGPSLFMSSVNDPGEPPLLEPAAIDASFGERVAALFDAGPPPLAMASTVVRCAAGAIDVVREGTLLRDEVLATAATTILFACTGNTCRSPLAAVIARRQLADRLGVDDAELAAHGLVVLSAGLHAGFGAPASHGSVEAAAEFGLDLSRHRARPLSEALARRAARIYCMTASHAAAIVARWPDLETKVTVLEPGSDVADPFGGDLPGYRAARDQIAHAIGVRLDEMVALDRA